MRMSTPAARAAGASAANDRTSSRAGASPWAERGAEQHVGGTERARDADGHRRHVLTLLDSQARPEHRRQASQLLQALAVLGARRTAWWAHDQHVELGVQALGERQARRTTRSECGASVASASSRSAIACGAVGEDGREPGSSPRSLSSSRREAGRPARGRRAHQPLDLDILGHLAQRGLAQRRQVLDLEEVVQRACTRSGR